MVDEDVKNLVIARLMTVPKNIKLSIGGLGTFTTDELIERIKREDEVGKKVIEMQLYYLKSLKKGIIKR